MAEAAEKKVEPRKKNTAEKPHKLEVDHILKSEKGTEYLVESKLGAGGFGEVWKVSLLKEPEKRYAMKTEENSDEKNRKRFMRLKMEVNLFLEIQKAPGRIDKTHFVKMYDKGKTVDFKYYIMDLIWMSLKDLKGICGGSFTPHTIICIARQTLKGIGSLHELGFLHRDIKAANFAAGLPPADNIIYTLDFGIARNFRDKEGGIRHARKIVKFMGTMMFASMEALCLRDQARRDDLEAWCYMMLDIYDQQNLPWCNVEPDETQLHVDLRMDLLTKPRELHEAGKLKAPEKWCDIIEALNGMAFEDAGDFTQLNLILSQICVDDNIDENRPLDWIGKKVKSPEKPKEEKKKPAAEKKIEPRKKRTVEKGGDGAKKEGEGKRRARTEGDTGGSGGTEEEESDDYEAYLRWKKRRRARKKCSRNKRQTNENSDRDKQHRRNRKRPSKEKKAAEGEERKEGGRTPEAKENPDARKDEDKRDKKEATPEKKEPTGEDKDKKKAATPDATPEKEKPPVVEPPKKKEDNHHRKIAKKEHTPTPESNESGADRDINEKRKALRKGNKTPDADSQEEKEDKARRGLGGVRKRGTNIKDGAAADKKADAQKKKKDDKPVEKPAPKPATPEPPKKANEPPPPLKKSDGRK